MDQIGSGVQFGGCLDPFSSCKRRLKFKKFWEDNGTFRVRIPPFLLEHMQMQLQQSPSLEALVSNSF